MKNLQFENCSKVKTQKSIQGLGKKEGSTEQALRPKDSQGCLGGRGVKEGVRGHSEAWTPTFSLISDFLSKDPWGGRAQTSCSNQRWQTGSLSSCWSRGNVWGTRVLKNKGHWITGEISKTKSPKLASIKRRIDPNEEPSDREEQPGFQAELGCVGWLAGDGGSEVRKADSQPRTSVLPGVNSNTVDTCYHIPLKKWKGWCQD